MKPLSAEMETELAGVLEEYLDSLEAGETPSLEQLAEQRPELATALPEYLDGLRFIHQAVQDTDPVWVSDSDSDQPKRLGDFELVGEIGRGGMGVVYEAWQESLNRRVALKVLPFAALLDDRQIARFRTEAQAAAGLSHPHIVPVHAVGTERGVHFYAMQLINGQPLTRVIDDLRLRRDGSETASHLTTVDHPVARPKGGGLSSEEAHRIARIGMHVAEALEHAHQYGVVHRDIKPSNLLMDADGKVWVTDFGLAQAPNDASLTRPGDVLGTPQYMSPEQAEGRGDRIDGRTDIYSLGATLYELLTLTPAHPAGVPRTPAAVPQRIERRNPGVPKDLRTIVHRALEPAREDRYATAADLAADLRRFLEGRPIVARSPSPAERVGKWIGRRKKTAAAIAATLLLFTVLSTVSAVWIAAALAQSRASQALAESHYQQARTVVDHFGGDLADRLARLPGAERIRHELLADTLTHYNHFLATSGEEGALGIDVASTHFKAAAVAERLADLEAAKASYRAAVTVWRDLVAASTDSQDRAALATGLSNLARLEAAGGDRQAADDHYREAIALETALAAAAPDQAERHYSLAETSTNYGLLLCQTERQGEGVVLIRKAIEGLERARQLDPSDDRGARNLALANNSLCNALRSTDPNEAAEACDRALAVMTELAATGSPEAGYSVDLAMLHNNRAALASDEAEWGLAAQGYGEAAEILARLVRLGPATAEDRRRLAITHSNRGLALARHGDPAASEDAFRAAIGALQKLTEDYPEWTPGELCLVSVYGNQGVARSGGNLHTEAIASFEEGAQLLEKIAQEHRSGLDKNFLNRYFDSYTEVLEVAGREEEIDQAESIRDRLLAPLS